ncbi:MAG: threonine aldolase family protein [Actinomycetota bacterium]
MRSYRVDLRSDTVTRPSDEMRRAMAGAEVGDAWYGDDPSVNRLQDRAAEVVGTEAALYVPTGTMANQIALRLHARGSGHLVACERRAHVASTEVASSAVLSGIAYRRLDGVDRGHLTAESVTEGLEPDTYFDVEVVDLVAIENTAGYAGGTCMRLRELEAIRRVARSRGIPVHLDGARLFNATAATDTDPADYGRQVDTLMFCTSKGLGGPIGSLLCGPVELMPEARRVQILFGGAWRQAGAWRRRDSLPSRTARSASTRTMSGQSDSPQVFPTCSRDRSTRPRSRRTWCSSTSGPRNSTREP